MEHSDPAGPPAFDLPKLKQEANKIADMVFDGHNHVTVYVQTEPSGKTLIAVIVEAPPEQGGLRRILRLQKVAEDRYEEIGGWGFAPQAAWICVSRDAESVH